MEWFREETHWKTLIWTRKWNQGSGCEGPEAQVHICAPSLHQAHPESHCQRDSGGRRQSWVNLLKVNKDKYFVYSENKQTYKTDKTDILMSLPSPMELSNENVISTKWFLGTSMRCTLDLFRGPSKLAGCSDQMQKENLTTFLVRLHQWYMKHFHYETRKVAMTIHEQANKRQRMS